MKPIDALIRAVPAVAIVLAAVGCGPSSDGPKVCNMLVDDAPKVSLRAVAAAPPAPAGGTIAAGTYQLSAMTLYTGPGGITTLPATSFSAVFDIAGTTMQQVGTIDGETRHYTSTFAISGTTISTTDSCPTPDGDSFTFTATATGFAIYSTDSDGTLEQKFTIR